MKKILYIGYSEEYELEVVDSIPHGHTIWNVPGFSGRGYIPLVRLSTESMKAIKCEDSDEIMSNLHMIGSVKETETFFKKYENDKTKQWEINRIKKSLPLIKKLKGWENIIN